MFDEPMCGSCGKVMTRENARIRPELFLHDDCLPDELKPQTKPVKNKWDLMREAIPENVMTLFRGDRSTMRSSLVSSMLSDYRVRFANGEPIDLSECLTRIILSLSSKLDGIESDKLDLMIDHHTKEDSWYNGPWTVGQRYSVKVSGSIYVGVLQRFWRTDIVLKIERHTSGNKHGIDVDGCEAIIPKSAIVEAVILKDG